ncbi:hypothetical protein TSOC_000582 [Tetrabaena socialis]|uniref:Glycosyl transferase family 1 domain-containing protein n=1 Tax=Tetrabaena socialis TaxID=47790 RepID=A0A2J8AJ09_9CHLO|nr:hypothetical protein TSOC_000582 [Tetrabaena socialis]|eukprot:PNH12500.1 hypothetical protein TSOC_000582 [Tetrabaena socialis]
MRFLFLTLEFRTGTFSGNGVYATAQVRALAAAGHELFVVSARPGHAEVPDDACGAKSIIEIPVQTWHRLDAGAPWREYAAGVLDEAVGEAVRAFAPEAVLGVDWSALQAARNLAPYCGGAPYVYLNYRVFTRTATGEDLELVRSLEAAAMAEALLTVALSRSDAEFLASHVAASGEGGDGQRRQKELPPVLLPALREDVRQIAPPPEFLEAAASGPAASNEAEAAAVGVYDGDGGTGAAVGPAAAASEPTPSPARPYLSCVVRLSPEKEPERFVAVVEAMAAQGVLARHRLKPLMLGVAEDEYAQGLKARLRAAAPDSTILERFIGPRDLAALFCQTRLNFHPSTYDAYGMTIVEAASQGAPSIVHDGNGAVGATDLLRGGSDGGTEVFLVDLTAPPEQVAAQIDRILDQPALLAATSARACSKARSWDEAANAAELVRMVRQAMQCGAGQGGG